MAFDKKTDPEVSLQDEKIKSEKEKLLAEILNKDTDDTPDSEDQTVVINTDYDIPIEYGDSTSDSKADDADELVKNIELFMNCDEKELMGLKARAYYDTYFERQKFMDTIEAYFRGNQ